MKSKSVFYLTQTAIIAALYAVLTILQSVIFGFAGIEITEDGIVQLPASLPSHWKSLTVTGVGTERKTYRVENNR